MRLGHCICDPKTACPCDRLREQDICPCAGEAPEPAAVPVRLTQLVEKAGCASKIDQASLKRVLEGLPASNDPRVLVGMAAGDDAGVFRYDSNKAWVQTVDVFSPSVDDPYLFGQVAAANSVSDIYAMGGTPLTALSIIGFPIREVPDSVIRDILRGGIDKMAEAGVAVIGGHSIQDKEIKAGFAVTGLVDPDRIITNAGVRPGDVLVLTKPIGTGIIAFAAQIGRASGEALDAAARSMTTLNKAASELMIELGARACTDITGFGLIGHLSAMAVASKVDIELVWDDLPLLPSVLDYAAAGIIPGAVERNRESCPEGCLTADEIAPAMLDICFDPQTSGGLLVALPEATAATFVSRLHTAGMSDAAVVGRAVAAGRGHIRITTTAERHDSVGAVSDRDLDEPRVRLGRDSPWRGSSPRSSSNPVGAVSVRQGSPKSDRDPVGAVSDRDPVGAASSRDFLPTPHTAQTRTIIGDNITEAPTMPDENIPCCSDTAPPGGQPATASAIDAQKKFHEFLKAVNQPGTLDAYTKQAIAIALSVANRCEPCLKMHLQKARDKGFSQAEIDEAAWMAIAFGGSPLMVWYDKLKRG